MPWGIKILTRTKIRVQLKWSINNNNNNKIHWKEILIRTRKHKSQRKYSKMLRIFSISQIFAVTLTRKIGTFEITVQKEYISMGKNAPYKNIINDP